MIIKTVTLINNKDVMIVMKMMITSTMIIVMLMILIMIMITGSLSSKEILNGTKKKLGKSYNTTQF